MWRGVKGDYLHSRTKNNIRDQIRTGIAKRRSFARRKLTGRYQGYHRVPASTGVFEVFWRAHGWWWWLRAPGCAPKGEAVGPFVTTTEAYSNATAHLTGVDLGGNGSVTSRPKGSRHI